MLDKGLETPPKDRGIQIAPNKDVSRLIHPDSDTKKDLRREIYPDKDVPPKRDPLIEEAIDANNRDILASMERRDREDRERRADLRKELEEQARKREALKNEVKVKPKNILR